PHRRGSTWRSEGRIGPGHGYSGRDSLQRKRSSHYHGGRGAAFARVTASHAQKLSEGDVRPPRIIELAFGRECFRQKLWRENFGVESIRNFLVKLLQHNS